MSLRYVFSGDKRKNDIILPAPHYLGKHNNVGIYFVITSDTTFNPALS